MTDESKYSVSLRFPAPTKPLSINTANKMHWGARTRRLAPWRESVGVCWLAQRKNWKKVKGHRCSVYVEIPFETKRRRDPHNFVGTICKALVDELVLCGVWPDDTTEWVTVIEPVLKVGGDVIVELTRVP